MNNFYSGSFSSCWVKSKGILEFLFRPNSNWICPQFGIWISNWLAQIHTLPLKIGSMSLNKFCRVQNFEEVLFWPKFDFYTKFWSDLKKTWRGDKLGYSALEGGMHCRRPLVHVLRPAPPRARPRSCWPTWPRQGVLIRSMLFVAWIKPRTTVKFHFFSSLNLTADRHHPPTKFTVALACPSPSSCS